MLSVCTPYLLRQIFCLLFSDAACACVFSAFVSACVLSRPPTPRPPSLPPSLTHARTHTQTRTHARTQSRLSACLCPFFHPLPRVTKKNNPHTPPLPFFLSFFSKGKGSVWITSNRVFVFPPVVGRYPRNFGDQLWYGVWFPVGVWCRKVRTAAIF